MNEFFYQYNYSIVQCAEIFAALTGLVYYKKYRHTATTYFIWFLVYVVMLEFLADYPRYVNIYTSLGGIKSLIKGTNFESNYWFYTLFWGIGSALFYAFYFRRVTRNQKIKTILTYAILTYIVVCGLYFAQNRNAIFLLNPLFINVSSVLLIIVALMFYLLELLASEDILKFHKSINFYIAITVLLWYVITTPVSFYGVYFSGDDWNFIFLRWQIYFFANVFMYLTFTFALIWCNPQKN